jgi:hypothetical protein
MNNKLVNLALKFAQNSLKDKEEKAKLEILHKFALDFDAKLRLANEELMGDLLELKESWINYPTELRKVLKDIATEVIFIEQDIDFTNPQRAAKKLINYMKNKSTTSLIENFEYITKALAKKNNWDENRFRGLSALKAATEFAQNFIYNHPSITSSIIPDELLNAYNEKMKEYNIQFKPQKDTSLKEHEIKTQVFGRK